jgi:hypothetical protein
MKTRLIGALGALLLALGATGVALSDQDREHDDDHDKGRSESKEFGWEPKGRDLDPATDPGYRSECGGCHLAYAPGLLPADAWRRVMGDLADHFGDDATLDAATAERIRGYLVANSADGNAQVRSRAFAVAPTAGNGPPRITDTLYFQRKHDEIPLRLVRDNPGVGSFSRCETCHGGADEGRFNEDQVRIPGVGRWED